MCHNAVICKYLRNIKVRQKSLLLFKLFIKFSSRLFMNLTFTRRPVEVTWWECVTKCLPLCAELNMDMQHVIVVLWLESGFESEGQSPWQLPFFTPSLGLFELWKESAICFSDYRLTHNKPPTLKCSRCLTSILQGFFLRTVSWPFLNGREEMHVSQPKSYFSRWDFSVCYWNIETPRLHSNNLLPWKSSITFLNELQELL